MRRLTWLFFTMVLSTQLQGKDNHKCPLIENLKCHGGNQNDLIPILRVGVTPRFFEDTSAMTLLGEIGRSQNRLNATLGFPLCSDWNRFKISGEVLNQQLSYHFPYKSTKSWTRQYAAGGAYQLVLNCWGLKTLELGGQWSNAQGHQIHKFHFKRDYSRFSYRPAHYHEPTYHRRITSSNAYAFSAGLTIEPWFWATLSGAYVYDKVDYKNKFSRNKVVAGSGGTVFFQQLLSSCFSVVFKGEFRAPYNYYEGRLDWRTILCSTDVIIGVFGGHTQGRKCLPDSTVAGLELGFDFGLTNYSVSRSVGLCGNSSNKYNQSSCSGLDRHYLEWMATPAVYIPEVLAIGEQHRVVHDQHHHHHHNNHHHHQQHHHPR